MARKMKAIELAEGALLVDVAVIFHLLTVYLPVGGGFFRMLTFVVFTVIVLRQGLRTGIMALWVSLFMVAVTVGIGSVSGMFLVAMGGLFLGVTMQRRMHHLPLLLLGITGGALALFLLVLILYALAGLPLDRLVHGLHVSYQFAMQVLGMLATRIGWGSWWRQQLSPLLTALATPLFTYWMVAFYLALWVALCPFVCAVYTITNSLVRLLGYDVRPFPGGWLARFLRKLVRRIVKFVRKRNIPGWFGGRA